VRSNPALHRNFFKNNALPFECEFPWILAFYAEITLDQGDQIFLSKKLPNGLQKSPKMQANPYLSS
jgi:hypothetical protein